MARLRRWATQQRPAEVNLKDGGVGREEQMVSRERRIRWVTLKCTSSQYSLLACQSDAEVHMLLVDYKAFVTLGIPPLTYNPGLSCGRQTRYFTHTNIWQRPKPSRKYYKTQVCFYCCLSASSERYFQTWNVCRQSTACWASLDSDRLGHCVITLRCTTQEQDRTRCSVVL